jgi:hypothetical protein
MQVIDWIEEHCGNQWNQFWADFDPHFSKNLGGLPNVMGTSNWRTRVYRRNGARGFRLLRPGVASLEVYGSG